MRGRDEQLLNCALITHRAVLSLITHRAVLSLITQRAVLSLITHRAVLSLKHIAQYLAVPVYTYVFFAQLQGAILCCFGIFFTNIYPNAISNTLYPWTAQSGHPGTPRHSS